MIDETFVQRGWQAVPGRATPSRYQVFGERSSGTNFVKRLIGRNLALTPTEDFGWKHGFPAMTAIPDTVLIVCVVRNARDWALSMHKKPWHCPPDLQTLPFDIFLRTPWTTIADRKRYFPAVNDFGGVGRVLQLDRHPLTGRPFATLFALRQAKLQGLLSFFERDCALVFCRLEAVQDNPQGFLADLTATFGATANDKGYRPVVKRLGAKFLPNVQKRPPTPETMALEDLAFLRSRVDPGQEAQLGYSYAPT